MTEYDPSEPIARRPFNLSAWIDDHRDQLRPPVANKQVWRDADKALKTARAETKTRHDLIENQYSAVSGAEFAHALEVAGHRGNAIHVAGNGFGDHAGDLLTQLIHGGFECGQIVEGEGHRVLRQYFGHAGRTRYPESERARPRLDE